MKEQDWPLPSLWLPASQCELFLWQVLLQHAICHDMTQVGNPHQNQHHALDLHNCELNKPFFFIGYPALGSLLVVIVADSPGGEDKPNLLSRDGFRDRHMTQFWANKL
jgi:hypothetical protein